MAAGRRQGDAAPRPRADAPAPLLREVRKGRGATIRIRHRFDAVERVPDGDALDAERLGGDWELPDVSTSVTEEHARRLLAWNDSPDIPFDRSINPYRGCEHGCIYCYARPTHSYLNLSPGVDFESKLVAKVNAVEQLRAELAAPSYRADVVNIGSATDAYQPIERELRITRGVLALLAACQHPFSIVTKSSLVERDLDIIAESARSGLSAVSVSLTTLDSGLSRKLEPRAASPQRRLRTIEAIARAGVPTHVNVAPVIPFITEPELERLLKSARDAGATVAHYTVLRLPWEVGPLFRDWLATHFPDRAQRVMNRVREMRGGKDYDSGFATRMKGEGPWALLIRDRFSRAAATLGYARTAAPLRSDLFVPPQRTTPQMDLF